MNVPFSLIKGVAGNKGVALLAVLIGLYAISRLKSRTKTTTAQQRGSGTATRL